MGHCITLNDRQHWCPDFNCDNEKTSYLHDVCSEYRFETSNYEIVWAVRIVRRRFDFRHYVEWLLSQDLRNQGTTSLHAYTVLCFKFLIQRERYQSFMSCVIGCDKAPCTLGLLTYHITSLRFKTVHHGDEPSLSFNICKFELQQVNMSG